MKEQLEKKYPNDPAKVREGLSLVEVETNAGAASKFPDGPKYVHYINTADPIVNQFGLLSGGAYGGKDAHYVVFNDCGPANSGDLLKIGSPAHNAEVYFAQVKKTPYDVALKSAPTRIDP